MATPETQRQRRIARAGAVACLVLALCLAGSHIAFLRTIQNNIVHADWCRFVQLVDDYHQGCLTVAGFLKPCNHLSILNPAIFLADGLLFGLDLRFYLYAPIVLLLVASYVTYRLFTRQSIAPSRKHLVPICFAPLIVLILSPLYHHTLTSGPACYNLTRTALYIIFFGLLSTPLSSGQLTPRKTAFLAVFLLFLTLVVGGAAAVAFGAAIVVVCVHAYSRNDDQADQFHLGFLALTALVALSAFVWIQTWLRSDVRPGLLFDYTLTTLTLYVLSSLGNPLRVSSLSPFIHVTGAIVLVTYVYGYWACLRQRRPDYFPLLLLLHSTFFVGLVALRIPRSGSDAGLAWRYLPDQTLGLIGVGWILLRQLLDLRMHDQCGATVRIHRSLGFLRVSAATCFVAVTLVCETIAFRDAIRHTNFIRAHFAALRTRMQSSSEDLPLPETRWPSWPQAAKTLRRYQLNVMAVKNTNGLAIPGNHTNAQRN